MGVRRPVKVHIEELVLTGFPASQRYRIADAVEREIARTIAAGGMGSAPRAAAIETVDGGAFPVTRESRPEWIGAQAGKAVFRSFQPDAVGKVKR